MLCKGETEMSETNSTFQSKVISEIIETEKTYLNQLEKLQDFFSKPTLERGLLPSHAHSAIFGQLSAIYQMNSRFLEEILLDIENIGGAFLKFGPFLKVYSSYANNFQRSLEILQKWECENEPFKTFVSGTETRPEIQMKLSSLLITPIQRIPRYKLLLEELLKYSNCTSQTFQDIKGALSKVAEAAKHIDRSVYDSQEFNRLLLVQRALKDQQPSIIAPGRKLLKEGILKKVSRKGKGSQSRFFFLFSDMIIYTKPPSQTIGQNPKESFSFTTEFDLKPNSLECCCMLPLRHCRVKTVFGSSDHGITFRLQCSDEDLLLYSATASEGEAWINAIKGASEEAAQKRKTLRKASSRRKAIRRTPLKSIVLSEDEPQHDDKSSFEFKYPKLFELESLKNRLRSARDCLTPPKPIFTSQKQKKIQAAGTSIANGASRPFEYHPLSKSVVDSSKEVHSPSNDKVKVHTSSGSLSSKSIQTSAFQNSLRTSSSISHPVNVQASASQNFLRSMISHSQNIQAPSASHKNKKIQCSSFQNQLRTTPIPHPSKTQPSTSQNQLRTTTSISHPLRRIQGRSSRGSLRNRGSPSRSLSIQGPSSHGPTVIASFRAPRPLSPLATCSWEDGSSPRSDSKPFVYQNGVRGREGSQLTPTSSVKEKDKTKSPKKKQKTKSPKTSLFSPVRKKRRISKD